MWLKDEIVDKRQKLKNLFTSSESLMLELVCKQKCGLVDLVQGLKY